VNIKHKKLRRFAVGSSKYRRFLRLTHSAPFDAIRANNKR